MRTLRTGELGEKALVCVCSHPPPWFMSSTWEIAFHKRKTYTSPPFERQTHTHTRTHNVINLSPPSTSRWNGVGKQIDVLVANHWSGEQWLWNNCRTQDDLFFPSTFGNQRHNNDVEMCRSADCTRAKDVAWRHFFIWLPFWTLPHHFSVGLLLNHTSSTSLSCNH